MHAGSVHSILREVGLEPVPGRALARVGGGDICDAWRVDCDHGPVFVKTTTPADFQMLQAEAEGLAELSAPGVVRVPEVLACDKDDQVSVLALEWLRLEAAADAVHAQFGEQLARMHRCYGELHGWYRDNTIGLTPQLNPPTESWQEFYADARLGFQLRLAADNGYDFGSDGNQLVSGIGRFFDDGEPEPSLLHGDLWGGNWSCSDGRPVMYDPAVFFGDRETDLAITQLFGGFNASFYDAYTSTWPVRPGYAERATLYQLYHVLNHLNLFGGGYFGRAKNMIQSLI